VRCDFDLLEEIKHVLAIQFPHQINKTSATIHYRAIKNLSWIGLIIILVLNNEIQHVPVDDLIPNYFMVGILISLSFAFHIS
jgi:hypothetical protein